MKEGNVAGSLHFILLLTLQTEVCGTNVIGGINAKGRTLG
jgi:hypothetical protein